MKDKRHYIDFLLDIDQQITHIRKFIGDIDFDEFSNDIKVFYAVCRALEIIGEAVKRLPDELKSNYPAIKSQLPS